MKRLIAFLAVVGMLIAMPLTHIATAKPAAKVDICHVNSANDFLDFGNFIVVFGKITRVNASSVPAHEAHGDRTEFGLIEPELRDVIEEFAGISLPNADCAFIVE